MQWVCSTSTIWLTHGDSSTGLQRLVKQFFSLTYILMTLKCFGKNWTLKECTISTLSNGSTDAITNLDKANLLNASFVNSFSRSLPELNGNDLPEVVTDDCPDDLLCTEEEVYDLLCSLATTKASGHDDISAWMLKETALTITPAVTQLFNISIRLGEVPNEWKIACVSPIPKSNSIHLHTTNWLIILYDRALHVNTFVFTWWNMSPTYM